MKLPFFAVNHIILFTSVAVRNVRKIVSSPISLIMLNWCAAVVRTLLRTVYGIINLLIVVNIFNAWKPNWAYAMPLIRCRQGKLKNRIFL